MEVLLHWFREAEVSIFLPRISTLFLLAITFGYKLNVGKQKNPFHNIFKNDLCSQTVPKAY